METLYVKAKSTDYPIYINDSFSELKNAFIEAGLEGRKICIICDSNTNKLYLEKVINEINGLFSHICHFSFKAGENSKNLDVISEFYKFFIENKLDRKSVIAALGGGVAGDMAGFAASTFMRGINFVQIPTSLLAQVDSSVGGKTGVDFMGNKNMIGAFYQPNFVYINSNTLKSLPQREFCAGMAEAIKHGYIIDEQYLNEIEANKENIKNLETNSIHSLIYKSCKNKAYVVSKDEKESGLREILNFGHTFGHAVESLSGFSLIHGECVAAGMTAGLYLSSKMGMIDMDEVLRAKRLLSYFMLPVNVKGYDKAEILNKMLLDKKTKNNKINLVLLKKIGEAYTEKSAPQDLILSAIEYIVN